MACQIAPELEDNLKEYILKTMKEVKKETVSRLNKQPSKEDNKSQPSQKELLLPKAQTNENLMEIEDEKTFPIKLNTNSYISNNNLNNNNSSINSSNNNNISYNPKESIDNTKEKKKNSLSEFDDIKKIENLLKFFSF